MKRKVSVTISLCIEDVSKLEALAKSNDLSLSKLVEKSLRQFLKSQENKTDILSTDQEV